MTARGAVKVQQNPALAAPLRLVALAYGAALRLRERYYEHPGAARPAGMPVISVGNLTVGGTGKTPMVIWLARRLLAAGRRPVVLSRGYGGTAGRGPLLVSDGEGPRCEARLCGDEPLLLARALPGVRVSVGSDRCAGAADARRSGADVAILDDGFQHRRLARDLDIVLLDATNPFGNYRLLPAGLLREPIHALARADVLVVTRSRPDERLGIIERIVRHHNPGAPILRAGHRRLGFVDPRGATAAPPARAVVFCGIGNPTWFRIDVEAEGVEIVAFEAAADHHRYTEAELRAWRARAAVERAALLTTEKDLARLDTAFVDQPGPPLLALRIEATVYDPQPLDAALARVLDGTG